jgi:glycosyltransferase involved in cell wall biosynthesis
MTGRANPLRIVHLAAPGPFGGLETVVQQLAIGLHRRGHAVRVLCPFDERADAASHPLIRHLASAGVDAVPLQLPRRAYLRERSEIARNLQAFEAEVLHTHGYHGDVVGALAARDVSVPRVATAHGFTEGSWKNRLYEFLQRRSYRSAAAVLAVSAPLAERLARDPALAPAVQHLSNAWIPQADRPDRTAAREALGLAPDAVVAGWVGRMSREKAPDVAIAALRDPSAAHVTLCMVGDGSLRSELQARGAAGEGAEIVWTGAMTAAGRLFAAFDVLVLSSHTEGTPMVLFEAMEARVPIVATRVGGVPDVLGRGEAVLVSPGDPDALREAVLGVLADPAAAEQMADRAARRLETAFGADAWLSAHEDIYRRVIAGDR